MKIIKPSVEFLGAVPTSYAGAVKFIERAGRTCYKSEDKITEDSAEKFVKKLISAGHLAMVEHSNFVVGVTLEDPVYDYEVREYLDSVKVAAGKFLNCWAPYDTAYIGGNLTAWYQAGEETYWQHELFWPFWGMYGQLFGMTARTLKKRSPLKFQICSIEEIPQELHRYSAKFVCDRGVSHELVRHRPCSFAQESTRYVNYGGKDMEFIEPAGYETWSQAQKNHFEYTLRECEDGYKEMLTFGSKPQQARAVLPNALKTEIIVTADLKEWQHIFKLRCAPSAHPDFVQLAVDLRRQFEEAGLPCATNT